MYFLIPSGVDNEHIINTEGRAGWFYLYGQLVWTVNLNSIIFSDIFLPLSKKKKKDSTCIDAIDVCFCV